MEGLIYRCLYEGCVGGCVFSSAVRDYSRNTFFNFKYVSGANLNRHKNRVIQGEKHPVITEDALSYFFLSTITFASIKMLVAEVNRRHVETVVLPYLSPKERLSIVEKGYVKAEVGYEEMDFITNPDRYLESKGVKKRLFICGNGADLPKDYSAMSEFLQLTPDGEYFEKQSKELQEKANQQEGKKINLVKAGYIKMAEWFIYFGIYGKTPSIVMFTGPLRLNRKDYNSKMYAAALSKKDVCRNVEMDKKVSGCVQCIFQREHISFCSYAKQPEPHEVCGHFLLGNYNLNVDMGHMLNRFSGIRKMIRVVAVPNCGKSEYWNKTFASLFTGDYSKYWYINIVSETEAKLMMDISSASPRNRFFMGTEEMSYCLTGELYRRI